MPRLFAPLAAALALIGGVLPAAAQDATPAATPPAGYEAADVTVELREGAVGGLERGAPAGPQVWQVTNAGREPHYLLLAKAPAPVTAEQVLALLRLPEGGTPPPGVPALGTFEDAGGLPLLAPGRTAWLRLDLTPGTYVAACFAPDAATGQPHAALGEVAVFAVGGGGTPTA